MQLESNCCVQHLFQRLYFTYMWIISYDTVVPNQPLYQGYSLYLFQVSFKQIYLNLDFKLLGGARRC